MFELSVLMATYNGEKYIKEQLDSLQAQDYVKWTLYIRDDCSTDNTINIIKEYQNREPRIQLLPSSPANIGALGNFNRLMSAASGNYFMFCDQDDIWFPDKIKQTVNLMKNREKWYGKDFPILIHTDCSVIDSTRRLIAPSFMKYQHMEHEEKSPLRVLLTQNFVTGCTVMINKSLLSACLPVPSQALMHDWWVALVAAAVGKICYLPQRTMLYRHHGKNVAGAKKLLSTHNLKRLLSIEDLEKDLNKLMLQNRALMRHLDNRDTLKTPQLLYDFLSAANQSGYRFLKFAIRNRIYKQGIMRNFVYMMLLLRRSYRKTLKTACA
jgi:glycosyltransferase involved in cell wall biosynthesis